MSENGTIWDIHGDLNPGTWFDMEGGGRLCVRVCAGEDYRNIRSQSFKRIKEIKSNKTTRAMEVLRYDEEIDPTGALFNELLWDFCIVDWEKFFDKDMNPIPCTKENKILLMNKSIKFSKFFADCIAKLTEVTEDEKEEETKN